MPHRRQNINQRKVQLTFGLFLAALLYAQFQFDNDREPVVRVGSPVVLAAERVTADPFESLIRTQPLEALKQARRHAERAADYTCTMVKQELLPSGMSPEQEIEVKFRSDPFSVYMNWLRNPGMALRVIYVKGRWIDADASRPEERELAVAQPGRIAQLFVKSVKQPIRGRNAKKSSRRFLDEFGFARALDLLIRYCDLADQRGELDLKFCGESHFDGRPVWVLRRTLPYTGEGGEYPDRTAEVYIDKEYRVPVAVYCYSDTEMHPSNLLGKYEYRNVRFDAGLSERDFDPSTYGM